MKWLLCLCASFLFSVFFLTPFLCNSYAKREMVKLSEMEARATALNERAPAAANPLFNEDASGTYNPARLPYVRRVVAVTLMTIASPIFFRFYTEEAH